jgi:arylsulfatase A-like enzyme
MGSDRRNLVLLTVDAWRADFVDDFEGVALLPSLAEVAPWCARFEDFHANAPWTTPALITVLTGESPARHGVCYQWSFPRESSPGIAKVLGAIGYALPSISYLNSVNGYQNLGFAPCAIPDVAKPPAENDTLLATLREYRRHSEPFFLWYHYKDLHFPYWPGESYRRRLGIEDERIPPQVRATICTEWNVPRSRFRFAATDRDIVQRLYAAEVLEFNDFLAPILEELLKDGLLDRTTLVLTADHADEHLEHGHVGHASTAEHATLYEEVLRTPLLVVDSRVDGPRRIEARAQGLDLHATMLSLVGAASTPGPGAFDFAPAILGARGDLPDPQRPFYFHSARMGFRTSPEMAGQIIEGISDGKTKFVAEHYDGPRLSLFDLQRDPQEKSLLTCDAASGIEECRLAHERLVRTRSALAGGSAVAG